MSESMIELMAKAIYDSLCAADDPPSAWLTHPYDPENETTIDGSFDLKKVARALIANRESAGNVIVPREPTEAMLAAATATSGMSEVNSAVTIAAVHGYGLRWHSQGDQSPLMQAWKAMISAAKETT